MALPRTLQQKITSLVGPPGKNRDVEEILLQVAHDPDCGFVVHQGKASISVCDLLWDMVEVQIYRTCSSNSEEGFREKDEENKRLTMRCVPESIALDLFASSYLKS